MVAQTVRSAGVDIPKLGIGTYQLHDDACRRVVAEGLALGYRHVDTAEMYQNEAAVGDGMRASGVPREDIFVTTKVWYDHVGNGLLQAAAENSLERLGVEYVDLLLIHWPNPDVALAETMAALGEVKARGRARAIGVSNHPAALLDAAWEASAHPLAVNQVEYHPFLDQTAVLSAVRRHDMALTAYCPLARGKVVRDDKVVEIADRHGVSPSAVALAWLLNQDRVLAIPKTSRKDRLADNLAALEVTLSADEMATIAGLATPGGRLINPAMAPHWDDLVA